MPKTSTTDQSLENEIALLRDLLEKATSDKENEHNLEEKLAMLDSVGRATPQLARLLKAQRELAAEKLDPFELLRQALRELEGEWPELHSCKERLRNSGVDPATEAGV